MLSYQGVEVQKAFDGLSQSGIQADIAREIIGIWVGEAAISSRRFAYSHVLTAAEAACSPAAFARSFEHNDWIDGESVVQAGETPTEEGFNDRFHRIEADLDNLGALLAQCFTCMNDMRATLAGSLREISDELNRVNADLADLRRRLPAKSVATGPINSSLQFIGKTKYFDKNVMVFQDPEGRFVNLPDIATVNYAPSADLRAPKVAEVFGRDPEIVESFAEGMTKKEFVDKWGDRLTADGTRLSDILVSLPDGQRFDSPQAVVDMLADQDVSLIKGLGGEAQVRSNVGVAAGGNVAEAKIGQVEGVSEALSSALAAEGFHTVADLKDLSSERVVEIGLTHGVDVSTGLASGLLARGKVLRGL